MDADTKAELDKIADVMEAQHQVSRQHAAKTPKVLTDGICRIRAVDTGGAAPCVGYVWSDLWEKFPVFSPAILELLQSRLGQRVRLHIRMSEKGTRYVIGCAKVPIDCSQRCWPCPNCHELMYPNQAKRHYVCRSCSYQMEVGP